MRLGRVYRSQKYPLKGGWPGYGETLVVVGIVVIFAVGQIGGLLVGLALIVFGAQRLSTPPAWVRRCIPRRPVLLARRGRRWP